MAKKVKPVNIYISNNPIGKGSHLVFDALVLFFRDGEIVIGSITIAGQQQKSRKIYCQKNCKPILACTS